MQTDRTTHARTGQSESSRHGGSDVISRYNRPLHAKFLRRAQALAARIWRQPRALRPLTLEWWMELVVFGTV